jgi:hypothetical protein
MSKEKSTLEELINRYLLKTNDAELADALITEMQRLGVSSKLNQLTNDSSRFKEEALPRPDFVFLRKITKIANETLHALDDNLEFRFQSAKQYGNLWISLEDEKPSPQEDMQWPLKYSFSLIDIDENHIFFIDIYGVHKSHMNFRVRHMEYSEYEDNCKYENEDTVPVDEIYDLIPVFMKNLVYCADKGDLGRNLFAKQEEDNDDDDEVDYY